MQNISWDRSHCATSRKDCYNDYLTHQPLFEVHTWWHRDYAIMVWNYLPLTFFILDHRPKPIHPPKDTRIERMIVVHFHPFFVNFIDHIGLSTMLIKTWQIILFLIGTVKDQFIPIFNYGISHSNGKSDSNP